MQKGLKNSIWFNILLLLVVLFIGYSSYGAVRKALELDHEKKEADEKIAELVEKKTELEKKIAKLETSEEKERDAKERLNMKNTGENVVVIVEKEAEVKPADTSSGWWASIKNFFKTTYKTIWLKFP